MEATVTGDSYVVKLAAFVRANEAVLSGSSGANAQPAPGPSWLPSLGPSPSTTGRRIVIPPKPLQLSLHHLSYLLLRFDALGLPVGKLDEPLDAGATARHRTTNRQSTFSYISVQDTKSSRPKSVALNADTASINSVRSALSRISISAASTTTSWFGSAAVKPPDPDVEVKRLYSALTKLPALDIVPAAETGLIEGFDDQIVPTTLTPLDCFKNLQLLSLSDVDPRTISGWDRLACQLKSLSINRGVLEDLEDFFVKGVAHEAQARRGPDVKENAVASTSTTPHTATPLPSLAWHFLTHLSLPSSSLTFFADLPLYSLRSLDLSHNLLNSIPPSLSSLTSLQSLDLSGNLIEDCRGAHDLLPSIKTLNLRGNRIEFLSGLEGLNTLRQVDLRENEVYEASEVGRLAQLPVLNHIWIKGNPVYEEYPDPRVEVFLEFAKDGWPLEGDPQGTLTLDGEVCGYFERKRVVERLPLGMKLTPAGSKRRVVRGGAGTDSLRSRTEREGTPRALEGSVDRAAEPDSTKVVSSSAAKRRSRQQASQQQQQQRDKGANGSSTAAAGSYAHAHAHAHAGGSEKRRHRRIVHLDDEDEAQNAQTELSEAEQLKRDVLSGGTGTSNCTDSNTDSRKPPVNKFKSHTLGRSSRPPASPANVDGDTGPDADDAQESSSTTSTRHRARANAADVAQRRRSKITTSLYDPPPNLVSASSPPPKDNADDLRARIQGLKREVGDDWLRVLSRGGGSSAAGSGTSAVDK